MPTSRSSVYYNQPNIIMETNSIFYFACLLILPTANSMIVTITATLLGGVRFKGEGAYIEPGHVMPGHAVEISEIIEPDSLTLEDLMQRLRNPLMVQLLSGGMPPLVALLLGLPQLVTYAGGGGTVVRVPCNPTDLTNCDFTTTAGRAPDVTFKPAVDPAVAHDTLVKQQQDTGLVVVTKTALLKFIPNSSGNFSLSLSFEDASTYYGLSDRLGEFWDSGADRVNILGENLTQIQVTASESTLTYVTKPNSDVHLRLTLSNGNSILVDAFLQGDNEIWLFKGSRMSHVALGETVAREIEPNFDQYFTAEGVQGGVLRIDVVFSKHGKVLNRTGVLMDIKKLNIRTPPEYGELLTFLQWE